MTYRWGADERQPGNPFRSFGNFKAAPMPTQRVKVLRAGWYGPDRLPVEIDQEFSMPLDEARAARALGRVEFV